MKESFKARLIKKLDNILISCEAGMPCSQPHYLLRYDRCRPQISTYSLISVKGNKNEKISHIQPTPTPLHARKSLKGGLCERREGFNEVCMEYWSDPTQVYTQYLPLWDLVSENNFLHTLCRTVSPPLGSC